ncbi:hypothetical protein [Absidia glauca]|uniref:Uncharacterized protein n=1 Tax=Absidia glauca TaxID=4829 RepID=A0A163JSF6_ABSGL|nr:hypothetical protein [Absidia glauca]
MVERASQYWYQDANVCEVLLSTTTLLRQTSPTPISLLLLLMLLILLLPCSCHCSDSDSAPLHLTVATATSLTPPGATSEVYTQDMLDNHDVSLHLNLFMMALLELLLSINKNLQWQLLLLVILR